MEERSADATSAAGPQPSTPRAGDGSAPEAVGRGTFTDLAQLAAWLETHKVDTRNWGRGKAKHARHLMAEVEKQVRGGAERWLAREPQPPRTVTLTLLLASSPARRSARSSSSAARSFAA